MRSNHNLGREHLKVATISRVRMSRDEMFPLCELSQEEQRRNMNSRKLGRQEEDVDFIEEFLQFFPGLEKPERARVLGAESKHEKSTLKVSSSSDRSRNVTS